MDTKAVFAALYSVCEENVTFFLGGGKGSQGEAARRLVEAMKLIQEHAHSLEPVIAGFAAVYHHFDFDPHIPANGYRSLVKVSGGCLIFFVCVCVKSLIHILIFISGMASRISPQPTIHCHQYSLSSYEKLLPSIFFTWYCFISRSVQMFH